MLLSDRDIAAAIAEGRLGIEPYDKGLVQPSSIDVRLDRFFRVFNNARYTHIDPAQQQDDLTTLVEPDGDEPFVLHPGEFVLGSTLEVVSVPDDLAARLEGKSSLGRLGLLTHSTAGFVDPGFSGHITLELSNVANLPIMLWPGMKIGQLCLFRLSSAAENPYGSLAGGAPSPGQPAPTPPPRPPLPGPGRTPPVPRLPQLPPRGDATLSRRSPATGVSAAPASGNTAAIRTGRTSRAEYRGARARR